MSDQDGKRGFSKIAGGIGAIAGGFGAYKLSGHLATKGALEGIAKNSTVIASTVAGIAIAGWALGKLFGGRKHTAALEAERASGTAQGMAV